MGEGIRPRKDAYTARSPNCRGRPHASRWRRGIARLGERRAACSWGKEGTAHPGENTTTSVKEREDVARPG